MRCLWLATLVALTLPAIASGGTPDYMPLAVGNEWSYVHPTLGSEIRTVDGMTSIRGDEVFVIRYQSADNDGLENYWTTGADGDLVLWGFFRSIENFGFLYDPPIVYLDSPLSLGKTWSQSSHVTSLPDSMDYGTYVFAFGIVEAGPVTVPAGTFDSFGLGPGSGASRLQSVSAFSLAGERHDDVHGTASDWFSDGVGEVQYSAPGGFFQLTTYTLPTVVRARTWGALKTAYR